ncbi:MAG: hypothetical protein HWN68_14565 [Desulfobacterales bacterium]|nr:hypothetical protein [Desulfobacterales bacterium]
MSYGEEIKPTQHEIDTLYGPFFGPKEPIAGTRIPVTRTAGQTSFQRRGQRIGAASPGFWDQLKTWWQEGPTWQKGLVIGGPLVVLLLALAGGKKEEVKKL